MVTERQLEYRKNLFSNPERLEKLKIHAIEIGHNNKGLKRSIETKNKLRDLYEGKSYDEIYGKERGDIIRNKISIALKGKPTWTKGNKNPKLSIRMQGRVSPMKGKKHKSESILKMKDSLKGRVSSMKGKKHSLETIALMKINRKGKISPFKGKHRPELSGKNNNFWKGGITPINQKIRQSIEMQVWRNAVFSRDGFTCVNCNQVGGKLNAHHIKKFSRFPELRFAIDNGITLCKDCHKNIHKKRVGN